MTDNEATELAGDLERLAGQHRDRAHDLLNGSRQSMQQASYHQGYANGLDRCAAILRHPDARRFLRDALATGPDCA